MAGRTESDVVIVGAGTSGCYVAWKLAEAGYRCIVLEGAPLTELGKRIGPFHMEEVAFERFYIPLPEGAELLHRVEDMTMWSPTLANSFHFKFPTMVIDKPLFMQRLHGYARDAGAEILERAPLTELVMEGGYPRGVRALSDGEEIEARGRLLIDASGIDSAVRTRLPASRWHENEPISDRDTIFVYMETWRDLEGDLPLGVYSYPYFQGWCAPGPDDTRIVGIGMAGSPDAARKRHAAFVRRLPFTGQVVSSTTGRIPYRHPPFSLVDNGLMVVGDAACMNKPFSGEGVTSAFAGCQAAIKVAGEALAADDCTRDSLWAYNTTYFRDQGAKFAFLTAALPGLLGVSESEMDLLFSLPGVMTERSALALQLEYEVRQDMGQMLKALPLLGRGLADRSIHPSTLVALARAGANATALKNLYQKFPGHPMDFERWLRRVVPLWRGVDRTRYRYFEKIAAGL